MEHTKLTLPERRLIARWMDTGMSLRACARRLGRSHATIARELQRNRWTPDVYEPLHAHGKARQRQQRAWGAKHPLKNPDVYSYVLGQLREGWSPDVIAGRLREIDHPCDPHWQICHETIYRFIYHPREKTHRWWEYLRRKQKRRRARGGRTAHRVRIPDRVSIHQRPVIVTERKEPGHWEGDSLVGWGRLSGLHTEYERVSSLIRFEYMERLTAMAMITAAKKIFAPLPRILRQSTTLDNGLEHVEHVTLHSLGMRTYFADPYAAYQRGGGENANLWIRYYFPKGTDFRTVSEQELREVEYELNTRPRKRLGYKTPLEVFDEYVNRCDRC